VWFVTARKGMSSLNLFSSEVIAGSICEIQEPVILGILSHAVEEMEGRGLAWCIQCMFKERFETVIETCRPS